MSVQGHDTPRSANDMLMGGGGGMKAVSFGPIGATPGKRVRIHVTEEPRIVEERDQEGKVRYWDNSGEAKTQPLIVGRTEESNDGGQTWTPAYDPTDEKDDGSGTRGLFVKMSNQEGGQSRAIREAVALTGAKGVEVGSTLELEWYHEVPVGKGKARLFRASYTRPGNNVLMGDQSAAPAPQSLTAAPAPTPAPSPPPQNSPVGVARALIGQGLDDNTIASVTKLQPEVIAALRNQTAA